MRNLDWWEWRVFSNSKLTESNFIRQSLAPATAKEIIYLDTY
jgi:hypothetical protein